MQGTALHLFGRSEGPFKRSKDPGRIRDPFDSSEGPVSNSEDPFSSLRASRARQKNRDPSASKGAPPIQGIRKLVCPPPLENTFRRHWIGPTPSCKVHVMNDGHQDTSVNVFFWEMPLTRPRATQNLRMKK